MKIYTGLTLIFALVILIGSIPISDSRSIDIGGAGGARVPPEFGCSEKGQSLISAYRSLAITTNTAGFKRLSMSLDRLISEGFYLPTHKFLKNILEAMRQLSARLRNHPFDQEVNNHHPRSTRRPKSVILFAPQNNDRFDVWGK